MMLVGCYRPLQKSLFWLSKTKVTWNCVSISELIIWEQQRHGASQRLQAYLTRLQTDFNKSPATWDMSHAWKGLKSTFHHLPPFSVHRKDPLKKKKDSAPELHLDKQILRRIWAPGYTPNKCIGRNIKTWNWKGKFFGRKRSKENCL